MGSAAESSSARSEQHALELVSHSLQQTQRLGARLGEALQAGDVVLLEGELGAGKTALAQGIARGLGVTDPVTSPTFTLVHEHRGRLPFYHVDLYRIAGDVEAADLGLEDYLYGDGVTVIEWPVRAAGILPPDRLTIELRRLGETKREIRLLSRGARYERLLTNLSRQAFGT